MKLSIIIPIYKKPESLRRLLRSCQQYTSPKVTEIILVIDDDTDPVALQEEFPNHKITVCGCQTGAAMAIWKGVLVASGKYVGLLGDDTELTLPDTDWEIVSALSGNEESIVGINDNVQEGRAHPFMSREYWLSGGGYPPCYRHYYGDTEIYEVSKHWAEWIFLKNVKIIHHHKYAERHGATVDIIEKTPDKDRHLLTRRDGPIFKRRMEWWKEHSKPRTIPWSI